MTVENESKPMLCEVCGRFTEVEWHSITVDYDTSVQCSAALELGGAGYWLCSDLCHSTAHELMKDDTGEGKSARVIGAMVRRLAEAVSAKSRKYHKRGRTNGR